MQGEGGKEEPRLHMELAGNQQQQGRAGSETVKQMGCKVNN